MQPGTFMPYLDAYKGRIKNYKMTDSDMNVLS